MAGAVNVKISDKELRDRLLRLNQKVGPITSTTRPVYLRRLSPAEAAVRFPIRRSTGGGGGYRFSSDESDEDPVEEIVARPAGPFPRRQTGTQPQPGPSLPRVYGKEIDSVITKRDAINSTTAAMSSSAGFPLREGVSKWEDLKPGDHICWERDRGYDHRAIVVSVDAKNNKLTYIDLCSIDDFSRCVTGNEGEVAESTVTNNDLKKENLYRYNYGEPEQCLTPEKIINKARGRIGKEEYNLLTNNCVHFATWCKTRTASSSQITKAAGAVAGNPVAGAVAASMSYQLARKQ